MNRRNIIKGITALPFLVSLGDSCVGSQPIREGEEWQNAKQTSHPVDPADMDLLKTARENIQKSRKGTLRVELQSGGSVVSQANFEVELVQHHFGFGFTQFGNKSAINKIDLQGDIGRIFNNYTAKCYWNERWHQPIEKIENQRIYTLFEEEIETAARYGMKVKGHPLVWTVPKALPEWLLKYPKERRLEKLLLHVADMMKRYKGKVQTWDLCNEFLWEPSLNHTEERKWPHIESVDEILSYLEPAVKVARATDTDAKLVLNDYGLEKDYRTEISAFDQRKRYVELVHEMKKRGHSSRCHWHTMPCSRAIYHEGNSNYIKPFSRSGFAAANH